MTNYSQNGTEQDCILKYFAAQPKGNLLDCGAYDLMKFSNSRALVELGWNATVVECSPSVLRKVYENVKGYEKQYTVVPYAISQKVGTLDWFDSSGDAISSLSVEHTHKWSSVDFKRTTVEAITFQTLLERYGMDFDFLTLDVESTNREIFDSIPANLFDRLKLICVEYDNHLQHMESNLHKHGFKTLLINGENLICGK